MHIRYSTDDYEKLDGQHNIMVLVGNGFDIAVLNKYGDKKMNGKSTKYSDFFEYVTYFRLCDDNNLIYKKMKEDHEQNKENWCDFESSVDELLGEMINDGRQGEIPKLETDLDAIQNSFSRFLNDIVTTDVVLKLNDKSKANKWADTSLSKFMGDINPKDYMMFVKNTYHYNLYNFIFVNFNYTELLDNYIYLDKSQFEPHRHKNADRNFTFFPNPDGKLTEFNEDTSWSSYIMTNIIHPHGRQNIPRSMIFGTELENYDKSKAEKRLIKSYWAQDDLKYKRYFKDTELFIIYGMSMSNTDGWWMNNIYNSLKMRESELIIYNFEEELSDDDVKQKFLDACTYVDASESENVKAKIYVVQLQNNENYFLGLKESN